MSEATTLTPTGIKLDQFKILRSSTKSPEKFDSAVRQVIMGIESGSIRNSVLQDVKFTLSRMVDDAWQKHVGDTFFYGGKFREQPEAVQELHDSINMWSLHHVISASKRITKTKATGPAVEAMRAFCAEALPLAEAMASLKDKVKKGREPTPAKPVNPDKVVKTCPVCFRPIAVLHRGTMAHHGYRRPGHGWQTASCPGIQFKPLEVSSEGLEWLISSLRTRLTALQHAQANQDTQPEFLMASRSSSGKAEKITRNDPLWPRAFKRHIAKVESEIRSLEHELPLLEKKLANWKPGK